MKVLLPFAALLFAASSLHAQTYKWVDEKGVTNYSNKVPAAKAVRAKVVEDRISIIGDPDLAEAADKLRAREERRAEREYVEWRTRQRAATAAPVVQTYAAYDDCAYADCGYGYGGYVYQGYFGGYRRHFRGAFPPRAIHHRRVPLAGAKATPLR